MTALAIANLTPSHAQEPSTSDTPVIEITAEDYAFEAPDMVASGWTTVRYTNEGEEPHLLLFSRIPEGKTVDDYLSEAGPPYNEVWYQLRDGEISADQVVEALGPRLPEWFWSVEQMGGTGLVMPGGTAETTMKLEPGLYAIECYAKTAEGELHFMEGMIRPLTVTNEGSDASPPSADLHITLSNYEMKVEGTPSSGKRTIQVHFAEQPEQGFGHNVHLTKLEPEMNVEDVLQWINWFSPEGLRDPAPSLATFLGGTHVLPAGHTSYFTVDLEPGRYLFVSEFTAHEGVWQEVIVER